MTDDIDLDDDLTIDGQDPLEYITAANKRFEAVKKGLEEEQRQARRAGLKRTWLLILALLAAPLLCVSAAATAGSGFPSVSVIIWMAFVGSLWLLARAYRSAMSTYNIKFMSLRSTKLIFYSYFGMIGFVPGLAPLGIAVVLVTAIRCIWINIRLTNFILGLLLTAGQALSLVNIPFIIAFGIKSLFDSVDRWSSAADSDSEDMPLIGKIVTFAVLALFTAYCIAFIMAAAATHR